MAQSEERVEHLGEIEAQSLEDIGLQRHCSERGSHGVTTESTTTTRSRGGCKGRRGRGRRLTEGLALDLLVGDGAGEVHVVHLLLVGRRVLLRRWRRRRPRVHEGRVARGWGRRGRGGGVADDRAHGGGGALAIWGEAAAAAERERG